MEKDEKIYIIFFLNWGFREVFSQHLFVLIYLLIGGKLLYNFVLVSFIQQHKSAMCSVAKSCPTLCDPMDCSPPG